MPLQLFDFNFQGEFGGLGEKRLAGAPLPHGPPQLIRYVSLLHITSVIQAWGYPNIIVVSISAARLSCPYNKLIYLYIHLTSQSFQVPSFWK